MFKKISSRAKAILVALIGLVYLASNTELQAQSDNSASAPNKYHNYKYFDFNRLQFYNLYSQLPLFYMMMFGSPDLEIDMDTTKTEIFEPVFMRPAPIRRFGFDNPKYNPLNQSMPENYNQDYQIDSSLNKLTTNYYVDSTLINEPYEISIDEYLNIRKKNLQTQLWDSISSNYDLKKALTDGDLTKMINASTGLTIPLPPNPVLNLFGKPTININVQGELNLRLGWRWDSQNLGSVSQFGQTQSSPVFSQDIKLIISGGIGDKLKLSTDWNTRRTSEFENKFKIGYEGEDDDIIKLIEVGNVTLPTQSSLISGSQSLFGVRADFQFGPLFLKTIASQKRGEKKTVDVKGGSSKQPFSIHAYDYTKYNFFVDTVYFAIYDDYFKSVTPTYPNTRNASYYRIKGDFEVWEASADPLNNPISAKSIAYANLPGKMLMNGERYDENIKRAYSIAGEIERGNFMKLDSSRYKVDRNLGTVSIYSMRNDRYYAVGYRIEGETTSPDDDIYYGTLSADSKTGTDTLVLKLIYRPNMQPGFKTLWNRQMKNIYSINASNVNTTDTKIGLWYYNQTNDSVDVLTDAKDKLVTIFSVDQTNNAGQTPSDGQFDMVPPFFNAQRGEIVFPSRKPFVDGIIKYFDKMGTPQLADKYIYKDVYDTTYDVAKLNTARDRFVISGEVTGKATNRIALGYFNLAQNSVKVYLDGSELKEYQDFLVDTYSGIVTLLNPRASLPNANLRIEFEQQDIFNISTKTLLGLRADYQLFKTRELNTSLGFTIMNYDQSSPQERARLGEEPLSNTMIGFDMKTNLETPWLTKALDYLPFYDTKAQSSFSIRGEWAMTIPTPNKRLSDVSSDNNQPVVYIDDFEGSQRYIPLGMSALQWTHASPPKDPSISTDSSLITNYKAKTSWYQYAYPRISVKDPYPDRETTSGNSNISGFYIKFDPDVRGIYNKNPEFIDSLNPQFDPNNQFSRNPDNRKRIWGGFQRLLSAFNTNFDTDNIEFIDIMMKINQWEPGKTKMYIDLGQISEDVIFNGALDTEDGITEANKIPNNIIDAGEDLGIDAMDNTAEKERGYPYPLNLENDPAKDDYYFDFNKNDDNRDEDDFGGYNNYQGNSTLSEAGQFPDTEILNKNNGQSVSTADDYFTYEVNLEPDPTKNPQIVGGNEDKGWYLYRVPIRKPVNKVGNPLFSNIQYVRVRFQGGIFKGEVAEWKLLGSYWQRINNIQSGINSDDSTMSVSFVNVEENSGSPVYYSMPPGVKAPTKYNSDPNKELKVNEQSLSLSVKNLKYSEERLAVRYFRQMDMFYYKYLKFFVHGDGSMPIEGEKPKAYSFVRFGIDSMNYYEYRVPLYRGWQNIEIDRDQLTAIKQLRDSLGTLRRMEYPVTGNPNAIYAVRGNPVLTKVQFVGFGIHNSANQYPNELTTTMWIDELRLLSPEDKADWAAVANADLKLADLATVNASISHSTPNFHKLEERFGDRTNSTNWSVSVTGNGEKFAPASFKEMKIPISYTHAEVAEKPEFVSNSDISVKAAEQSTYRNAILNGLSEEDARALADGIRKRSETIRVSDSWAIQGFKFGIPVNSWLIKETVNRVVLSYAYSQEWERNPNVEEKFNWQWRFNAQYSVNIPAVATISPLNGISKDAFIIGTYSDWKLNFLPTTFSSTLSMNRSRITEKSRYLSVPSPVIRNFAVERQSEFSWKISEGAFINPMIDYKTNTSSTLVPWELDNNGVQRSGSELTKQILFNDGKLLNLGDDNMHNQTFTLKITPRLPFGNTFSKFVDMSGSFMTNYNWTNPINPDPEYSDKAKTASFNNTINFKLGFKLKQIGESLLGVGAPPPPIKGKGGKDSILSASPGVLAMVGDVFREIFFDFEKLDITFNQTNASSNPGVFGGSGYTNFWRGAVGMNNENMWGPNALYQLGLISNPHGGANFVSSDKFPYFGFDTHAGLRPANGVFQDNFNQKSTLEARTSRKLWPGATLDLNWGTDLGYNRNQTVITDSMGIPSFTNVLAMESFTRTYLSMPSFFGLNLFNNNIENVIKIYREEEKKIDANVQDTILSNRKKLNALADAFHNGLEAFSIFGGKIGKFLPALNWKLTWEGIEKWGLWGDWVKKATIEHSYQSKYTEAVQITDNGRSVQSQQVQTGFTPLIGINITLNEKKTDGIINAQFKWNSTDAYSVTASNRATISRQSTEEIQLQAGYTMKGFEFPLFGLILKNDFEVSMLTSFKMNKRATYDVMSDENSKDGSTLDGNKQVVIEPRATYSISNKVRASAFFRYEGTFNEGAGSPGFTTTQVGFDLRVSLSGGR